MWLVMAGTLRAAGQGSLLRNDCPLPGPGPGGDEARRDVHRLMRGAELAGRATDDRAEGPAEGPQTREPDVPRHLGHRPVGLAPQGHRPLDPAPLQIAVRSLTEGVLEHP